MDITEAPKDDKKSSLSVDVGVVGIDDESSAWLKHHIVEPNISAMVFADKAPEAIRNVSPLVSLSGIPKHHLLGTQPLMTSLDANGLKPITDQKTLDLLLHKPITPQSLPKDWERRQNMDYAIGVGAAATKAASAGISFLEHIPQWQELEIDDLSPTLSVVAAGFSSADMITTWTDPAAGAFEKTKATAGFATALGALAVELGGGNKAIADGLKFVSLVFSTVDKARKRPNSGNEALVVTATASNFSSFKP